jgi:hypothetical protein
MRECGTENCAQTPNFKRCSRRVLTVTPHHGMDVQRSNTPPVGVTYICGRPENLIVADRRPIRMSCPHTFWQHDDDL